MSSKKKPNYIQYKRFILNNNNNQNRIQDQINKIFPKIDIDALLTLRRKKKRRLLFFTQISIFFILLVAVLLSF